MKKEFIESLSERDLVQLCNEIYDWKNGTGNLQQNTLLRKLFDENEKTIRSVYDLSDYILWEAHERFSKVVKVLFVDKPAWYVK